MNLLFIVFVLRSIAKLQFPQNGKIRLVVIRKGGADLLEEGTNKPIWCTATKSILAWLQLQM